ncbi:uncharacterized protein LOC121733326 [Aricia agestis]|uniref:uncharacterized protein LOC121733326 n=1 Tax=Aricia agestis TaxID=91739 RepID=UPI001C20BE15|nr:uncharacterized protein LOC121733326 [Aricia agestis]
MCCIFTCFGWMIDLFQRAWTFVMSCCIALSICCSLITASMAGIALGYNYSLAEYIDLKETNVSVYIKRGVFDDDISDDVEFRRAGHNSVAGHLRDENLMTGAPEGEETTRSGRRLEDSIYQSNDKNNFEDSLMKLTAKPLDAEPTKTTTQDLPVGEIIQRFPSNSIEQLKAFQSAMNKRRMQTATAITQTPYTETRKVPNFPLGIDPYKDKPSRRFGGPGPPISPLREAVPPSNINDPVSWLAPNLPPYVKTRPIPPHFSAFHGNPTYPMPVTPKSGIIRPTQTFEPKRTKLVPEPSRSTYKPEIPKSIDEEMDAFKEKIMEDMPRNKNEPKDKQTDKPDSSEEDYDYDVKGAPIRKKRSLLNKLCGNSKIKVK